MKREQRPNSWTKLGQKSFKLIRSPRIDSKELIPPDNPMPTGCLAPIDSLKIPARVCNVNIVHGNLTFENSTRLCPETSTKLYVHEFGSRNNEFFISTASHVTLW